MPGFVPSRRDVLRGAALGAPALLAPAPLVAGEGAMPLTPGSIPLSALPAAYDVETGVHNLENGYWSVMPRVVAEAFAEANLYVNRMNSIWARDVLAAGQTRAAATLAAQAAVAGMLGCLPEEIGLARSGSDALQMLIANYKGLKPGDAAIYCDLDYDTTSDTMEWLGSHHGVQVVKMAMPEPATEANILAAYEDVLKRTPNAKLLLVTLVSHRTGLVTPVREIVAMARARGVDTIVDAAHGVACLDFQLADLGADFVGWSLHKWTSAPLGTGALYIRKSRMADIDVAFGNTHIAPLDVNGRLPAGTINFAALLAIPTAARFHFAVGAAAKERHLRSLRDRWVHALRDVPEVEIMVPDDPARYCAITSFRLKGMDTQAKAQQLQRALFEKHKVHTVPRTGVTSGPVIRATPGLYSTVEDADALAAGLRAERRLFA